MYMKLQHLERVIHADLKSNIRGFPLLVYRDSTELSDDYVNMALLLFRPLVWQENQPAQTMLLLSGFTNCGIVHRLLLVEKNTAFRVQRTCSTREELWCCWDGKEMKIIKTRTHTGKWNKHAWQTITRILETS